MNRSGLRALILLGAAVPLVGLGNQAAGLAPGQAALDSSRPILAAAQIGSLLLGQGPPPGKGGGEDEPEEEAPDAAGPPAAAAAPTTAESLREVRRLERALAELAQADEATLADLKAAFEDEVDEVEADIDDLEADLDDRDVELDELGDKNGVDGSQQLRRAEDKLRELEDQVRMVKRQLRDIRSRALSGDNPAALLGEVRNLGAAIAAIKAAERGELEALIEAAERRERGGPPEDKGGGPPEGQEEETPEPSPTP